MICFKDKKYTPIFFYRTISIKFWIVPTDSPRAHEVKILKKEDQTGF